MTGKKLDSIAKLVSTQELTITGELAQEIGNMDSTSIVQDLKMMLDETQNMTDEQIRQEVIQIAAQYNVSLTETQNTAAHHALPLSGKARRGPAQGARGRGAEYAQQGVHRQDAGRRLCADGEEGRHLRAELL